MNIIIIILGPTRFHLHICMYIATLIDHCHVYGVSPAEAVIVAALFVPSLLSLSLEPPSVSGQPHPLLPVLTVEEHIIVRLS